MVEPDQLEELAGRYVSSEVPLEAVVEVVDGVLHLGIGGPPSPTVALSPTRFLPQPGGPVPPGILLTFSRSGNGHSFLVTSPDGFEAEFRREDASR